MPAPAVWLVSAVLVLATVLIPSEPEAQIADGDVVRVTGELSFTTEGSGGVGVFGNHALQWRDTAIRAELSTNEARLTGDLLLHWNCDVFLPDYVQETSGAIATGSVVLRNSGGAWEGVWRGFTYPDLAGGQHHILLTGSGPYSGHSALLYLTVDRGELVVDGLVFPGDMPPIPALPAE